MDSSAHPSMRAMPEVVALVDWFAALTRAPVRSGTTVTSPRRVDDGYHLATDQEELRCRSVVLASGA